MRVCAALIVVCVKVGGMWGEKVKIPIELSVGH